MTTTKGPSSLEATGGHTTDSRADCHDCLWSWEGMPGSNHAQAKRWAVGHTKATGHRTCVDVTRSWFYAPTEKGSS